ncbi:MAG: AAA family ATPase [Pyrinomonadaceae bacterium]
MHVIDFQITNIRSIRQLKWEIDEYDNQAGWHVIIGDNGSGKTTFLRSLALALVGPTEAAALRQDWHTWLRSDSDTGAISINFSYDKDFDKFSEKGKVVENYYLFAGVRFSRDDEGVKVKALLRGKTPPLRHLWGGKEGWFSVAYGPYRRFAGGDKDYEKLFYSNPKLAAHLSVFGENIALSECIYWLQTLQFQRLEKQKEGNLVDKIFAFVNQPDFLPHNTKLHKISSQGVEFVDGNGCTVSVEDLSDGFRSILSMTFEIIRQLTRTFGGERVFDESDYTTVVSPGIVLIDEIDAHLHPTWQQRIGPWFVKHFPNLQFIVTTHSPLICQSAKTIWRLPRPGTEEVGSMVTGQDLDRLRLGNILDAYGTDLFGDEVTRSDESRQKLDRLAFLNFKEHSSGLTELEQIEQTNLRGSMPTTASEIDLDAAQK